MDKQDNAAPSNARPFHESENTVPQWAFQLNSAPTAAAETRYLNATC
jgi:hypothetical protein